MTRAVRIAAIVAFSIVPCAPASAHLMNTGFGPFYDGVMHPLVSPEDLLPAVAVALWAGLGGPRLGRCMTLWLPGAWLCGMAVGRFAGSFGWPAAGTAALTIAVGAAVAADVRLPDPAAIAFAAVLGIVHGALNVAGVSPPGPALSGILGIAGTIFVLTTVLSASVVSLRRPWARIVVRVAGSWIAAMGLLMLGWTLRRGAP